MQLIGSGAVDHFDCGRHELTDEIYVDVMEYETKEVGIFESHHRFIHIHYLIHGIERIEIANEGKLSVLHYTTKMMIMFLETHLEQIHYLEKVPFDVIPGEAYLSGLKVRECSEIKKAVIKVLL